jgi:hypothetical protein
MILPFQQLNFLIKVCYSLLNSNVFTQHQVLKLVSSAVPCVGKCAHIILPPLAFLPKFPEIRPCLSAIHPFQKLFPTVRSTVMTTETYPDTFQSPFHNVHINSCMKHVVCCVLSQLYFLLCILCEMCIKWNHTLHYWAMKLVAFTAVDPFYRSTTFFLYLPTSSPALYSCE